jgi:cell division protein ZapA
VAEQREITVKILDKEYQFSCPKEEEEALIRSAQYLSKNMREIRDSGKVIGTDRIAVMAALNLTDQFLKLNTEDQQLNTKLLERIYSIEKKIQSIA